MISDGQSCTGVGDSYCLEIPIILDALKKIGRPSVLDEFELRMTPGKVYVYSSAESPRHKCTNEVEVMMLNTGELSVSAHSDDANPDVFEFAQRVSALVKVLCK